MYDENLLSVLFLQEASRDALGKVIFHKKGHESQSIFLKKTSYFFLKNFQGTLFYLFIYLFIYLFLFEFIKIF